jgi:predicted RNase H-like nuclease (RuvC/YqgF family)
MVKILLGITLAVIIATAVLGFLIKQKSDLRYTELVEKRATLIATQNKLRQTQKDLEVRTEELAAANLKIEEKDKEIATLKGMNDDLKKAKDDLTAQLEAKTKEVEALNEQLKKLLTTPEGAKVDIAELTRAIDELKATVIKLTTELAEARAMNDSLAKQVKVADDKVAVLEIYKKSRELGLMRKGTTGRIIAVNPGWNFVVLNIGDKQGAVQNGVMLVVRNGEPIAKIRITSVEPSTAIADILPNSLRKGITIQPGDDVIFEGTRANVLPAPAAAAPQPALPR